MATDSVALIFVDTEITAPPAKHGRQGKARSNIGMLFWISAWSLKLGRHYAKKLEPCILPADAICLDHNLGIFSILG